MNLYGHLVIAVCTPADGSHGDILDIGIQRCMIWAMNQPNPGYGRIMQGNYLRMVS
jgi:hypothetical protein